MDESLDMGTPRLLCGAAWDHNVRFTVPKMADIHPTGFAFFGGSLLKIGLNQPNTSSAIPHRR